jgi:multidrug efflux pump subunit AcrB
VLQTLVAEIYGPDEPTRFSLAKEIRKIFARTEGVVDVDWYVKSGQTRLHYVIDQEKAAHHGITTDTITRTLQIAAEGLTVGLLHLPAEREDVPLLLELAPSDKSSPEALTALHVGDDTDRSRPLVPLSELIHIEHTVAERDLYRKNLKPVTYVTGDVAGAVESPAYAMLKMNA